MHHAPCAMRHALCTMRPCAMHHAPCAMHHAPCAMCHVSCTMCHAPCTMCHVPCVMRHAPYTMCQCMSVDCRLRRAIGYQFGRGPRSYGPQTTGRRSEAMGSRSHTPPVLSHRPWTAGHWANTKPKPKPQAIEFMAHEAKRLDMARQFTEDELQAKIQKLEKSLEVSHHSHHTSRFFYAPPPPPHSESPPPQLQVREHQGDHQRDHHRAALCPCSKRPSDEAGPSP